MTEKISEITDTRYITIRNSLATKAENFTNEVTKNDKNHPLWNRIYFAKVDELAFEAGLQAARFHKDPKV